MSSFTVKKYVRDTVKLAIVGKPIGREAVISDGLDWGSSWGDNAIHYALLCLQLLDSEQDSRHLHRLAEHCRLRQFPKEFRRR